MRVAESTRFESRVDSGFDSRIRANLTPTSLTRRTLTGTPPLSPYKSSSPSISKLGMTIPPIVLINENFPFLNMSRPLLYTDNYITKFCNFVYLIVTHAICFDLYADINVQGLISHVHKLIGLPNNHHLANSSSAQRWMMNVTCNHNHCHLSCLNTSYQALVVQTLSMWKNQTLDLRPAFQDSPTSNGHSYYTRCFHDKEPKPATPKT